MRLYVHFTIMQKKMKSVYQFFYNWALKLQKMHIFKAKFDFSVILSKSILCKALHYYLSLQSITQKCVVD